MKPNPIKFLIRGRSGPYNSFRPFLRSKERGKQNRNTKLREDCIRKRDEQAIYAIFKIYMIHETQNQMMHELMHLGVQIFTILKN